MKPIATIVFITLLTFSTLFAADPYKIQYHASCLDNFSIDFKNDAVILTSRSGEYCAIKITNDDELYINGNHVYTNSEEKELLGEFRHDIILLIDGAKKIGCKGAKIGLSAVSGVVEALCTDLKFEELEDQLEEQADRLEAEADELENVADRLEDLQSDLNERIPELREAWSF